MSDDSPSVIGPPAPMPTQAEHWAAKFRAHIAGRCLDAGWGYKQAWQMAADEFNGLDEPIDTTEDPVASADESMSYWDADE